MSRSYVLHAKTDVVVMQDGSGVVLFSGFSGRCAFLQNQSFKVEDPFKKPTDTAVLLENKIQSFEIKSILSLNDVDTLKVEKWLLNNDFISILSH